MAIYKSLRNEQLATLVAHNEHGVILQLQDTGDEKIIAESTLKRWWTLVEADERPTIDQTLASKKQTSETLTITNTSETTGNTFYEEMLLTDKLLDSKCVKAMFDTMAKLKELHNIQVQSYPTTPGFYSCKVDGKIYLAFTATPKSITLWLKEKAVGNLKGARGMNHSFDLRFTITSWTAKTYDLVRDLHDKSLAYQINRSK